MEPAPTHEAPGQAGESAARPERTRRQHRRSPGRPTRPSQGSSTEMQDTYSVINWYFVCSKYGVNEQYIVAHEYKLVMTCMIYVTVHWLVGAMGLFSFPYYRKWRCHDTHKLLLYSPGSPDQCLGGRNSLTLVYNKI